MQFLVNIDVDDLGKAVQFYGAAFGLQAGRRLGENGVEMLGGALPIHLLCKQAGTRATVTTDESRRYTRHWSRCIWMSSSTISRRRCSVRWQPAPSWKKRFPPTHGASWH